ncbi:hypothetical protein NXS19_008351 [Fusarium pseudograminearum]|nr:hypothetical protein NXS19_008351 [Fusarium pseudograminearum]
MQVIILWFYRRVEQYCTNSKRAVLPTAELYASRTRTTNFAMSCILAIIRWDVKGGNDRDHYPGFDTWQPLDGTP